MTYLVNGLVEASDYNTFYNDLREVSGDQHAGGTGESVGGFGYGNVPIAINPVFSGDLIQAELEADPPLYWGLLLSEINRLREHQVNTIPFPDLHNVGGVKIAKGEIVKIIPTIIAESLNSQNDRFIVDPIHSRDVPAQLISMRTDAWQIIVTHGYKVINANWEKQRYFFNTSGTITNTPSYVANGDGPGTVDEAWDIMMTDIGSISMDHTSTSADGASPGTGSPLGFYDLTSSDQLVWVKDSTTHGTFPTEKIELYAKLDGEPGGTGKIIFRLVFNSNDDGTSVPGDITSSIGYTIGDGIFTVAAPTFITTEDLDDVIISPLNVSLSSVEATFQECIIGSTCPNIHSISAEGGPVVGTLSYVWDFTLNPDSDFTILSGQGTSSVSIESATGDDPLISTATIRCTITDSGRSPGTETAIGTLALGSTSEVIYRLVDKIWQDENEMPGSDFTLNLGPADSNRQLIFIMVCISRSPSTFNEIYCYDTSEDAIEIPDTKVWSFSGEGGTTGDFEATYNFFEMPVLSASSLTSATFKMQGVTDFGRHLYVYAMYTEKALHEFNTETISIGGENNIQTTSIISSENQIGAGKETYIFGFSTAINIGARRIWSPSPNPYTNRHLNEIGTIGRVTAGHEYMVGSEMPSYISPWTITSDAGTWPANSICLSAIVFGGDPPPDDIIPPGQQEWAVPGTYFWIAPVDVTSVNAVCIGGGSEAGNYNGVTYFQSGGGGGLAWKNFIPVVPGNSYTVVVGDNGEDSYVIDTGTVKGGGAPSSLGGNFFGDGGGIGGQGGASDLAGGYTRGAGGGGAGGYDGTGGKGGNGDNDGVPSAATNGQDGTGGAGGGGGGSLENSVQHRAGGRAGGTGLQGEGPNGIGGIAQDNVGGAGTPGSGGTTVFFGAGNPAGVFNATSLTGHGAVRLIWGNGRTFPSTNTGDV